MDATWFDDAGSLLCSRGPLPLDEPFTRAEAYSLGVSRRDFVKLLARGVVRPVLGGVYAAAQAPNDTLLRAQALSLVLPPTAVVTDRTAAWLHGVELLPRSALVRVPPLDAVHVDDTRVRRPEVDGRRRGLTATDVTAVHGVHVTTPLRTALDLGRGMWRFDALGAIDGFIRAGVPQERMVVEADRFRGYRGVRQLRALLPLGDGRAESMAESALRLGWHDAGLPRPELQWWVFSDDGVPLYRIDVADPEVRYGAEYDGEEFHTTDEDREHDEGRRLWLRDHRAWTMDAFTKADVYDRDASPIPRLQAGHARARRSMSLWTPGLRTP